VSAAAYVALQKRRAQCPLWPFEGFMRLPRVSMRDALRGLNAPAAIFRLLPRKAYRPRRKYVVRERKVYARFPIG
jgi:hypothetical protein